MTTSPTVGLHLWEVDHPYYGPEGCFYKNGHHHAYESFAGFLAEMGDADEDMNLVFRWDWKIFNEEDDGARGQQLQIFICHQRKAYTSSHYIAITEADEPAVLKYLTPKARHIARLWEPIWQGGAA